MNNQSEIIFSIGFSFISINYHETTFTIIYEGYCNAELLVVKLAEDYQEHMKKIPIPTIRRSNAMFITWHSLANSMKQFYGQPLHYLTYVLVKQWDQSRIGTVDEEKPMDTIIHPRKAESIIWDVEEVHRRCTSHIHLAKLWVSDPEYSAVVGDVIPSSKLVA